MVDVAHDRADPFMPLEELLRTSRRQNAVAKQKRARHSAASTVQRHYRGRAARQSGQGLELQGVLQNRRAATKIQSRCRTNIALRELRRKRAAAISLQRFQRKRAEAATTAYLSKRGLARQQRAVQQRQAVLYKEKVVAAAAGESRAVLRLEQEEATTALKLPGVLSCWDAGWVLCEELPHGGGGEVVSLMLEKSGSRRQYWYNVRTLESRWETPPELVAQSNPRFVKQGPSVRRGWARVKAALQLYGQRPFSAQLKSKRQRNLARAEAALAADTIE